MHLSSRCPIKVQPNLLKSQQSSLLTVVILLYPGKFQASLGALLQMKLMQGGRKDLGMKTGITKSTHSYCHLGHVRGYSYITRGTERRTREIHLGGGVGTTLQPDAQITAGITFTMAAASSVAPDANAASCLAEQINLWVIQQFKSLLEVRLGEK